MAIPLLVTRATSGIMALRLAVIYLLLLLTKLFMAMVRESVLYVINVSQVTFLAHRGISVRLTLMDAVEKAVTDYGRSHQSDQVFGC